MIVQVDNYTTENDSKNEKQYIAANKYLVLAAILMIINSVLGSFFALKDGIYYMSDDELSLYRRESPDHLSFIFRHNIIYYIVDDSGRWTLQVQVPDPFSSLFVVMDYSCYFNTYGTEYR
ncbi:unnamed protein product [Rotaria socialis]